MGNRLTSDFGTLQSIPLPLAFRRGRHVGRVTLAIAPWRRPRSSMEAGPTQVERQERRLAAILAADLVGSSRLIEADERSALAAIHAVLSELSATAEQRGGRLIKTIGDGALYEFASPVKAVACAIAVQEIVNERASGQSADRRILLRIGINLGDVVEGEGGD